MKYDVIIIGGGPAGSTAGYILSRAGRKVLILDKSRFPRPKLCAGCITEKNIRLMQRVFGETPASLKQQGIINFESKHYEVFCKDKSLFKKGSSFSFYFVERYRYDDFLLSKARQAGTEIIEGERCAAFDIAENRLTTSEGRTLQAKVIIGADGINSIVRKSFPEERVNQQRWLDNMAAAFEITVNRSQVKKEFDHPALYFDYVSHGYSWVFPNKDKLVIGGGGLFRKNKKQLMSSFHDFLSALEIDGLETNGFKASAFPYGNFIMQPAFGNTLLIGDAAGFADPLLGEGIFYAQRSAELAASAVLNAPANVPNAYISSLQEHVFPEFVYAQKIRDMIFTRLNRFSYAPLKIIMNMLGVRPLEAVHGVRSYKWFKRTADF